MSRGSREEDNCKVYVGDLPRDVTDRELEKAFNYYGKIRDIWIAQNPAGFAFVTYDNPHDARDAVKGLDGESVAGVRVKVEMRRGGTGGGGRPMNRFGGPPGRYDGPSMRDLNCYDCGQRGHFSRDCPRRRDRYGGMGRRRSRSRSRSRSRDRRRRSDSRSRTRSPRKRRSPSRSKSRSRDRKPRSRSGSRARSRKNRSRSRDRKSRSPQKSRSPVRKHRSRSKSGERRSASLRKDKRSRSQSAERKSRSASRGKSTSREKSAPRDKSLTPKRSGSSGKVAGDKSDED